MLPRKFLRARKAIRMVDQVNAAQNDMISGKVLSRRAGNCGALSFAGGSAYESSRPVVDQQLGSNYSRGSTTEPSNGVFPPALINLADEIIRVLRSRHEMGEKGPLEIRRSANGSGNPVRIRGVGVPNGHGIAHARIVLVLTEVSASHLRKSPEARKYALTVQHFEASPSLQDVSACHVVAAQLYSLLDVSLEPAISKCEIHHRLVCAT